MKLIVKVPKLGLTIEEVTVGKWTKSIGEAVSVDEVIGEIEADKATYEIIAPKSGKIREFAAQEGDVVEVGAALATIDVD
ncbi:MAG: dihydrolipoamide succinyltransferase [Aestuariivita sp.]|nr:dihydrolipoamide succinyltransferase [Aestuariivita sp.]MCY4203606.1 dihydrolipoamide succinyltransferase [Aestuariivita sp.]MCY4288942.1 dihydrolipoamide succinyltransferase [Aestuariivita sp.]MCY4346183.1 dihydrolipoamide succinyltransferase [Aestuariivita sp.]